MKDGFWTVGGAVVVAVMLAFPVQASIFDPNDNNGPSVEEDENTGQIVPTGLTPASGTFMVGPVSGFFSDDPTAGANSSGEPLADRYEYFFSGVAGGTATASVTVGDSGEADGISLAIEEIVLPEPPEDPNAVENPNDPTSATGNNTTLSVTFANLEAGKEYGLLLRCRPPACQDVNPATVAFSDLKLTVTPIPGAALLFAPALLGLAGLRYFRRQTDA